MKNINIKLNINSILVADPDSFTQKDLYYAFMKAVNVWSYSEIQDGNARIDVSDDVATLADALAYDLTDRKAIFTAHMSCDTIAVSRDPNQLLYGPMQEIDVEVQGCLSHCYEEFTHEARYQARSLEDLRERYEDDISGKDLYDYNIQPELDECLTFDEDDYTDLFKLNVLDFDDLTRVRCIQVQAGQDAVKDANAYSVWGQKTLFNKARATDMMLNASGSNIRRIDV